MDSQTEASREKKRRKRAEMRLQRDIETQKVGRMQNAQKAEAEAENKDEGEMCSAVYLTNQIKYREMQ